MVEKNISHVFWIEEVNSMIYTMSIVQSRQGIGKILYELWFGHTPTIKYFRIFRSVYQKR